jgi:hypothetical protein
MNDPLVSSRGCCDPDDPVTWPWQIHSALRFEMFVSINGTTWDAWPHQLHGWNRLSLWLKEEPTTRDTLNDFQQSSLLDLVRERGN